MSWPLIGRFRQRRAAMWGLALVALLGLFAVVGPWVLPHPPNLSDFSLARAGVGPPGPSASHWLGTDPLFRDLLSRLAAGTRLSLMIAGAATLMSLGLGTAVGVTAGYLASTRLSVVDSLLMRSVDVLMAFPFLLLVTAVGMALGRSDVTSILLVLGLTSWAGSARIVRAKTLELRKEEYVLASRALGGGAWQAISRHILPNLAPILIVLAATSIAQMVLAEAILSYLTVGVPPPDPSLGRMLHEAEPYLFTRPVLVIIPGFILLLIVLGFTRVGEGARDALDPRAEAPRAGRFPLDLALSALVLLLASFAKPSAIAPPIRSASSGDVPARGGTLRLGTYVNVRTLDPALAYDEIAVVIEQLVFDRLVTWSPSGEVVPDLASSFSVSPDGKRYTFTLREGVIFQDGARLGAADVKRSLERTLSPKAACPAASSYAMIEGFAAFREGQAAELSGVRVTGDLSLTIDLSEPDATFLPVMTLAFAAPVCPSMGAAVDPKSNATPCGAGPFRVESIDPDAGIRLARHERYRVAGRPYLDAITWTTGVRPTTQRYKFEDGDLDAIRELSGSDSALYRAAPEWASYGRWTTKQAINAVFMNTERPPFDNVALRRAVAFALDPSVLAQVRPDLEENGRVLPPSIPGPARQVPMRVHSLPRALEEMAKAGYPYDPATGKGGYPETIDYLTLPDTFEQQSAEVYQQQLAKVGIRIRLRLVSFATYLAEASRRGGATMGWCGWAADFPDPANFFEPNLSSAAISDEGSQNYAFFSSPKLDDLLARAHKELDHDARMALYEQAEALVRDEAPWAPTYVTRSYELWQPYVRGYSPHPVLHQDLREVWLAPRGSSKDASRRALGSALLQPGGAR